MRRTGERSGPGPRRGLAGQGRWPAVAALVLLAAACATGYDRAPEAALEVLDREPGTEEPPEAAVETEAGNLVVTGSLTAPDPCRDMGARVIPRGDELVLRVDVLPPDEAGACAQVLARYRYRAALLNLEDGRYRLTVIHTYQASGRAPDTVFAAREVVVP